MDETVGPADQNPDPYLVDSQDLVWRRSSPLGYVVPPVASIPRPSPKPRRRRAPYVSETGSIWSGLFWLPVSDQDPVLAASPLWKLRRSATRYPKGKRIRRLRYQYGCPPGCYPARLASLYDDLPWGHMITLDAPAGRFWEAWRGFQPILTGWQSGPRPEYRGFWLAAVARHPGGLLHAHLLVGGIPFDQIREGLAAWPHGSDVRRVYHRWGALHYVLAQAKAKDHGTDVYSYCPAVVERFESDNLQYLAYLTSQQILRTASRRSVGRSATWRRNRARTAALARWRNSRRA